MNEQTTNGVKVVFPDYLLPIFNRCLFTLTGCTEEIRTQITCDGMTYTDYRTPYNGKVELDIAGYLRAFFPTFKDDKVRAKSVSVKMYNGSTSVFDRAFLAIFAVSSPSAPLGKPYVQRWYKNITYAGQTYSLLASEGDAVGYKTGAVVWNQLAVTTVNTQYSYNSNYRAFKGVEYKLPNPSHKYLACTNVTGTLGDQDITANYSISLGKSAVLFNQRLGYFQTNGKRAVFFSPNMTSYKYIQYSITGIHNFNESWTFGLVVYDLTRMFGAGNEPTTLGQFEAMKPIGADSSVLNTGELKYTNSNTPFASFTGYKEFDTRPTDDIIVMHKNGEVVTHTFTDDDSACGTMLKWIDAQGFIRFFLFTEGEVKITAKDSSETITHDYQALQPVGGVCVGTMKLPQGVTTTVTQVLCAVLSTEEDRELLDTLHSAPLVWMVKPNGEEIPVTIKRGTRSTAKGLQDYEIEVNIASTEQNL